MAGEWMKMRTNLWDDPRVSKICDLTEQAVSMIIGGLYWLWATADEHSGNGFLNGLSVTAIDRKTGIKGFGAAIVHIGWLEEAPDGVNLVRFEEHNGATAKARAMTAKRVATHRSHSKEAPEDLFCNGDGNDDTVTGALAREDKNKSKKDKPPVNNDSEGRGARGTHLPTDWKPSAEDVAYCKTERPDLLPSRVAQNFYDYWIAKPGKDGRKSDWPATWRSWVRKERTENAPRPGAQGEAGTMLPFDPARPRPSSPTSQAALDAARQANTEIAERMLFGPSTDDERTVDHAP